MSNVGENLHRIEDALGEGVAVLPVTKNMGVGEMVNLLNSGARFVGESRIQDSLIKFNELEGMGFGRGYFQRHLIGHLQMNKVKKAVEIFDVIQSVDSLRVAEAISKFSLKTGRVIDVFLQINIDNDSNKYGFTELEVFNVVDDLIQLPSLRFVGLMAIGRFEALDDEIRFSFLRMKKIYDEFIKKKYFHVKSPILSMGMTRDYKIAVECGATMVRIGGGLVG